MFLFLWSPPGYSLNWLTLSLASPDNYRNSILERAKKPSLDIRAFFLHTTIFDPILSCVTCTIEIGSLNDFLPSFRLLTYSAATVSASHLRKYEVRVWRLPSVHRGEYTKWYGVYKMVWLIAEYNDMIKFTTRIFIAVISEWGRFITLSLKFV